MITIHDERHCLFVRFLRSKSECQWWLFTDEKVLQDQGAGLLSDALKNYKAERPCLRLILPASSTNVMAVDCPANLQRKLHSTLPYLVEERVISDIEQQQTALLGNSNDPVAGVIDRGVLDTYLQSVRALGWEPESIMPEHWLWLTRQSSAALHLEDGHAWYTANGQQVSCMPATLLVAWLATGGAENQPILIAATYNNKDIRAEFLQSLPSVVVERLQWQDELDWAVLLAPEISAASGGLAQGDYAPRADWRMTIRRWRAVITATIVLLIGHSAVLGWQQWQLSRDMQWADQAFLELFQQIRPNSRAVNPRVQLNQMVKRLEQGSGSQFMPLFYGLAERVHAQPDVDLLDVQYSGQGGRLQANVVVPDMPTLEKLLVKGTNNVVVTLNSSARQADGLRASLTVVKP